MANGRLSETRWESAELSSTSGGVAGFHPVPACRGRQPPGLTAPQPRSGQCRGPEVSDRQSSHLVWCGEPHQASRRSLGLLHG